jgi:Aminoglycoside-2''-adenylyltransferase
MSHPLPQDLDAAFRFYREAMDVLRVANVPFLVGGAYAFAVYTGLSRHTKDFDIFVRRDDRDRSLEALAEVGCRAEVAFPHWLAKACREGDFIDIIYSSGNGVARVDDEWFEHAVEGDVLGMPARLIPVEEMIWSKAFIMERERFDGADVAHLVRARGQQLDWHRLLRRFNYHWPVLLSHLILFGYIYPEERHVVPAGVMRYLFAQGHSRVGAPAERNGKLCQGTLLSREQYLADIEHWGYADARLAPHGSISPDELVPWHEAIWTGK